ncbi:MAG TPA: 3-dehydroquinate synthase [Actinomycetota bacterium]
MTTRTLDVHAGIGSYRIHVGAGLLAAISDLVPLVYERAVLVHDESLPAAIVDAAASGLEAGRLDVARVPIPAGEPAKSLAVAERVARAVASAGLHRGDLIAGLGGGATTDLSGFVAATYHRGVDHLSMPTTLLGMVDAAIGGKTAVNIPEGKNLVGAFHQPIAVVCDVETLLTLPDGELRSGLAEIVKHGFIGDPGILTDVRANAKRIDDRDAAALTDLVTRAAAVKVAVVEADALEHDVRATLNYGHTLGHAIESLGHAGDAPPRRHGEAVAIGMVFAAHLARIRGMSDLVTDHVEAVEAVGLPSGGAAAGFEAVMGAMRRDKKYDRGIRFVLLNAPGDAAVVSGVETEQIRDAYESVR